MKLNVTNNSVFPTYRQFAINPFALDASTAGVNVDHSAFSNSNTGGVSGSGNIQLGGSGLGGGDIFVSLTFTTTRSATAPR